MPGGCAFRDGLWLVQVWLLDAHTQGGGLQPGQRQMPEAGSDSEDWIKHGMTISLPSNPNDMNENQDGN